MSFHPLRGGFDQSLLGTGTTNIELTDTTKILNKDFMDRAHYLGGSKNDFNLSRTIIIIIISALLFVSVVSIYDVIRNSINNYFAEKALTDPKAQNSQQDINNTLIANRQGLIASIFFSILCIILAIIVIYALYYLFLKDKI